MKTIRFGLGTTVLLAFAGCVSQQAEASKPVAAVYAGRGACKEGCVTAVAAVAEKLGFEIKKLNRHTLTKKSLEGVSVWLQPGGDAIAVANALTADQKTMLRDYVNEGGAYVGFCAGGFLADSKVDDANLIDGLALLPGVTADYLKDDLAPKILEVDWNNQIRHVYFQGGPYFDIKQPTPDMEILARYSSGEIAALQFKFGAGRVSLSGVHPEAPKDWMDKDNLPNPGSNEDLAEAMLTWATSAGSTAATPAAAGAGAR